MSITDADRHQLYRSLEEKLGPDEARILMEHLPPVGWADVATKRDLDLLGVALRGDIESLRGDMSRLDGSLRGEMKHREVALRGDMARMEESLRGEIIGVELRMQASMSELKALFYRGQRNQTLALVSAQTALLAVGLAILRLG